MERKRDRGMEEGDVGGMLLGRERDRDERKVVEKKS